MGIQHPPKIFIVEDHPIFSGVLSRLLADSGEFEVLGTTCVGVDAINFIKENEIDILLIDLELPGISGLEIISAIRTFNTSIKIMIISGFCTDRAIYMGFTLGVSGFLEKSLDADEFMQAMRELVAGKLLISSRVSDVLKRMVQYSVRSKPLATGDLQVLRLLAQQTPIKEIAQQMGLAISTVYKTRERIMARTGGKNTLSALHSLAADYGMFQPDLYAFKTAPEKSSPVPVGSAEIS
jgi:DNA-binding NarL/FixJ family response regulator